MGPEGIILVNPPITTLQQSLTHSALAGRPFEEQPYHLSIMMESHHVMESHHMMENHHMMESHHKFSNKKSCNIII